MSAPAFDPNAPSEDVPPFDPNAPSEDVASPAEKRSFLSEAGHRVADFGRGVVENVKNIPSASVERVVENAKSLARPFKEAGEAIASEVAHPVRTFQGSPLAQATGLSTPEAVARHEAANREVARGLQSNIPLLGLAHEHATGFPEHSAEDAAAVPGASAVGGLSGAAMLGAAPSGAPLVGKGLNAAQDAVAAGTEATLARSAARAAADATPVRTALKDFGEEATKHSVRHGALGTAAYMAGGHGLATAVVAASLAKPALRTAFTVADEGLAAIARHVEKASALPVATAEYEAPAAVRAAGSATAQDVTAQSVPGIAGPVERRALPPMPALEATVDKLVDPAIARLEEGLKDATPEQATAIQAAIGGLKAKANALKNRPTAPPAPAEKLAPSLDERIAAMRAEPLKQPPVPAASSATNVAKLPPPAKPVANVDAILQPAIPPSKPVWEPSRADPEFAKKLGMPVDKYREMMARTSSKLTSHQVADVKTARLIRLISDGRASKAVEEAAQDAISAGADPHVIQRITTDMVKRAAKKVMTDAP